MFLLCRVIDCECQLDKNQFYTNYTKISRKPYRYNISINMEKIRECDEYLISNTARKQN